MALSLRAALATPVLLLAFGCSSDKVTPSAPTPAPSSPTSVEARPASLSVSADRSSLEVGNTVQLTATAAYTDGSHKDVSSEVVWASANEGVITVSGAGHASVISAGQATLSARWNGLSGSVDLSASRRKYAFSARVHEAAPTVGVALGGVQVAVEGGALSGATYVTDASGNVTLPRVEDPGFVVRFKRSGYDDVRLEVRQFPADASADVAMLPAGGDVPLDVNGTDKCGLPHMPVPCPSQPGTCDAGPIGARFPVYHSGRIDINNLTGQYPGIARINADGSYSLVATLRYPTGSVDVAGGYEYAVAIDGGDYYVCGQPWTLKLTHPK